MYLLVLVIPFLSFVIIALSGRFVGLLGLRCIALVNAWFLPMICILVFYETVYNDCPTLISLGSWFVLRDLTVSFSFTFDSLTTVLTTLVSIVSAIVITYSLGYMGEDPHIVRFVSYLFLFSSFMVLFVLSNDYILLFFGWEGVGLVSYLLINFFFTRVQANKSALKAVFINKFGDFTLLAAILIILSYFHSSSLDFCFLIKGGSDLYGFQQYNSLYILVSFLFLVSAASKSAQIPLHVWLPDAMEGPTPVSALLHAATMVTAGVFLLLRNFSFFELVDSLAPIICFLSSLTALFGAMIAAFQTDLKKVIAYSTCSQLGYMLISISNSCYECSLYHLFNHGFFKALLFLTAGCIIHALSDEQDMRRMGGLLRFLPISYQNIMVGSLALMGIPFLSGFFSKDIILETAFGSYTYTGMFSFILGILAAYFTSFYSARIMLSVFGGCNLTFKCVMQGVHEGRGFLIWPLLFLSMGSVLSGFILRDLFIGVGSHLIDCVYSPVIWDKSFMNSEFISIYIKLLPSFVAFVGALQAVHLYMIYTSIYNYMEAIFLPRFYIFFNLRSFFDIVYNFYVVMPSLEVCYVHLFKFLDRGFFEFIGPTGFVRVSFFVNVGLRLVGVGSVTTYLLISVLGMFTIFCAVFFTNFIYYLVIFIWFIFILFYLCNKPIIENED